jgi:Spy/CpxP family protein refolding chaperone
MQKKIIVASAAALFAASTFAASAQTINSPSGSGMLGKDCKGVNACKGQSACKSATNACKGQNACKGKGWVSVTSTFECGVLQQNPPK